MGMFSNNQCSGGTHKWSEHYGEGYMERNSDLMPVSFVQPGGFEKSNIKEVREKGSNKIAQWIKNSYQKTGGGKEMMPKFRFELLYRGTEFGCLAYMFHKKCDRQGPTVTFV